MEAPIYSVNSDVIPFNEYTLTVYEVADETTPVSEIVFVPDTNRLVF